MFRVRLASGEEAVYRSVEELALGINSGVVSEQAEIFHSKNQQWLPIVRHPEYGAAQVRAAALVAEGSAEPPPPKPSEVGTGEPGGPQVYQMFSYSARELEERRKPRWRQHAITAAGALLFLASLAIAFRPGRSTSDGGIWKGRGVAEAPRPSAAGGRDRALTPQQLRAPYNLARRLTAAQVQATAAFEDSIARFGLRDLLSPARLASPDSVRDNLARLDRLRPAVAAYRGNLRRLWAAYKDTSETLTRSGAWDRLEAQEWLVRISTPEPRGDAIHADQLLLVLEQSFGLLASQAEPPRFSAGTIMLANDSAGFLYDQLRLDLRRLREVDAPGSRRIGPPLMALLGAIGSDSLPPRRIR